MGERTSWWTTPLFLWIQALCSIIWCVMATGNLLNYFLNSFFFSLSSIFLPERYNECMLVRSVYMYIQISQRYINLIIFLVSISQIVFLHHDFVWVVCGFVWMREGPSCLALCIMRFSCLCWHSAYLVTHSSLSLSSLSQLIVVCTCHFALSPCPILV